jgi:hypothetical protein
VTVTRPMAGKRAQGHEPSKIHAISITRVISDVKRIYPQRTSWKTPPYVHPVILKTFPHIRRKSLQDHGCPQSWRHPQWGGASVGALVRVFAEGGRGPLGEAGPAVVMGYAPTGWACALGGLARPGPKPGSAWAKATPPGPRPPRLAQGRQRPAQGWLFVLSGLAVRGSGSAVPRLRLILPGSRPAVPGPGARGRGVVPRPAALAAASALPGPVCLGLPRTQGGGLCLA